MSEKLVCWVGTEPMDDEGHAIEFHPDGPAERESRDGVPMRRAPEFDRHAPGPIPLKALLAANWQVGCAHCDHHVAPGDGCDQCADDCADDECETVGCLKCGGPPDYYYESHVVVDGEDVYCGPWCRDAELQARVARKARKAAANL